MTPFKDSPALGKYSGENSVIPCSKGTHCNWPACPDTCVGRPGREELNAAHERIDELKSCLAEMVSIYWGDGDGIQPPPSCIQRAQAVLAETVQS